MCIIGGTPIGRNVYHRGYSHRTECVSSGVLPWDGICIIWGTPIGRDVITGGAPRGRNVIIGSTTMGENVITGGSSIVGDVITGGYNHGTGPRKSSEYFK